jgi:ABC-2 type transport system permease protein
MFFQLLHIELFKIFKRPRTFIAFGAIAVIVFLVQFALKTNGGEFIDLFVSSQEDTFDIPKEKMLNGFFICVTILHTILIHVPLLVALISGDMISGESAGGTLRILCAKPVSRSTIVLSKFAASVVYLALLLIWMALLSLVVSLLVFGTNDLFVFKATSLYQIEAADVWWRFLMGFLFATLALTVVIALSIMLSAYSDNSIGPIVATVCIVIVFTIIQQLEVPVFKDTITPWLFTTHMLGWKGFFYINATPEGKSIAGSIEHPEAIIKSTFILVAYIGLFLALAVRRLRKKDILS